MCYEEEGRFTPDKIKSLDIIRNNIVDDFSEISALVLTNCESMDEKTRTEVVNEFRSNQLTKATAELMKAGIYIPLGFPTKMITVVFLLQSKLSSLIL